jgi:hypothetical protein
MVLRGFGVASSLNELNRWIEDGGTGTKHEFHEFDYEDEDEDEDDYNDEQGTKASGQLAKMLGNLCVRRR